MGDLFEYARPRLGRDLSGAPLAVIDFETTGLNAKSDRVIEIAVARVEGGRIVDEWSSLINARCDPGPTFIHRITADELADAPELSEVVGELLRRLDGAVVVAHNASFEEKFLAAEFRRLGLRVPQLPALCTLAVSRQVLTAPNYKLASCCAAVGGEVLDAHTALGDVRATANLAIALMDSGVRLRWAMQPRTMPAVPPTARAKPRVGSLRRGQDGWMASLLTKLPLATSDEELGAAEAYIDAAESAIADGRITGDEARELAGLAAGAGLGPQRVADLNRRLLDALRDAALEDDILTPAEVRDLHKAAGLLAQPDYFTDLVPTAKQPERATRAKAPKSKGRIWLHPDLAWLEESVSANGFQVGRNITRTLVAVVVDADGHDHRSVAKAHELGVPLVHPNMLGLVLTGHDPRTPPPYQEPMAMPATTPPDAQPAAPPEGWYSDPAGRHQHRWWDGTDWTHHVADPGSSIGIDPL